MESVDTGRPMSDTMQPPDVMSDLEFNRREVAKNNKFETPNMTSESALSSSDEEEAKVSN